MTQSLSLLATRSAGKLRELRPLFQAHGVNLIDLSEAGIPETRAEDELEAFETFEENALAKARYFHRLSGRATFADDSGLSVDALNGGPGVRSKRWSGRTDLSGQALDDENNRLLLERLSGVEDRRARYVCAAAFVDWDSEIVRVGEVQGCVLKVALGDDGFGYDPLFWSEELDLTFGEASREMKERVSHRGRAFRALLDALGDHGVVTPSVSRS
ncbi:MAG TPA: non-canonical purine NTP pyrophosphatase [Gemmatimonadaceae bacterium]